MCNNPGTPVAFQEGGPVIGTVAGRPVPVGTPGQYQPGITDLAYGLMQQGIELPPQLIAQFSPAQLEAFRLASSGVGSYAPFLQQAESLTGRGVSALESALGGTRGLAGQVPAAVTPGQEALARAATDVQAAATRGIAGLAPEAALSYLSPFEDAVVQQTMEDIARQGRIAQRGLASQAVAAGAFGGSRGQQAQQELQRNVLEQQARSAAQLRAAGFESAAGRAMQAAQATGQFGMAGAQAAGNLGLQASQLGLSGIAAGLGAQQQAAGLGQGIAGLGQQFAGLGQTRQQQGLQDINTMLTVGQQQQRQTQAELDAQRANLLQQQMQPFQQLAFASDIITGAPSGQTSIMSQPGPSIGSQLVGLGTAAYGLANR